MEAFPMPYRMYSPPMQNAMGGSNLHTPQSIFQHMMGQQNVPQPPGPWTQMPQVPPMTIPWSVPASQHQELVRFTGTPNYEPVVHQKRKLEVQDLMEARQTKQFITEEKMAAHFKQLHISPNYQQRHPVPSTSSSETQSTSQFGFPKGFNMELDLDTKNPVETEQVKSGQPKLILSEELKRLQQDPILPSSLLSKVERPSMALVLWEPPSKHLRILPSRDTPRTVSTATDDNNNSNNNNNDAIPDMNQATSSTSAGTSFEPMEL